jgi:FtsZ-binding cell division protein ZapB
MKTKQELENDNKNLRKNIKMLEEVNDRRAEHCSELYTENNAIKREIDMWKDILDSLVVRQSEVVECDQCQREDDY